MSNTLVTSFIVLFSMALFAQGVADIELPQDSKQDPKKEERIEVTGSHIKRVDVEGPQPIQTLDRRYLETSGHNSVADILRDLPGNAFGSLREKSGSSSAGVAHVSLRGLGATRTLVLMDGRRLARDGVTGAPDLNLIPMSAIERVEILKDGSAATYGSDAVGGVVNIITKKDFTGKELKVRQEIADDEGGDKRTISGTIGWSGPRSNATLSVQYRDNQIIYSRDRQWSKEGGSTHSPSPNIIRDAPGAGLEPQGGAAGCRPPSHYNATYNACIFNYADYSSELPAIKQLNLLGNFRHQLSSDTELFALLKGTRKHTDWRYAPGAIRITKGDPGVENLIIDGQSFQQVRWRSLAFGTRDSEVRTNALGATIGLNRTLSAMPTGENWELQAFLGVERIKRHDRAVQGYAKKAEFLEAIKDSSASGCDILNNNCPYSDSFGYVPWEVVKSQTNSAEVRISGDLLELPAGDLSMALGLQAGMESYSDDYDALSLSGGVIGGGDYSRGAGSRKTVALYNEFALPLRDNLDVQLAGRFDHYSDFGSSFNPKLSAAWRPLGNLLVRASAGTSFKAPDMIHLHKDPGESSAYFVDEVVCRNQRTPAACRSYEYQVFATGNKDLQEEKSRTFNLGVVYQPWTSLDVGVDAYAINMENTVGLDYQLLTEAERDGVDLARYQTRVERNANGRIDKLHTRWQNLSETRLRGLDFNLKFRHFFAGLGKVTLTNDTSYLLEYQRRGFPGTPLRSILRRSGAPQWRNTLGLDFTPQGLTRLRAVAAANTIGSHRRPYHEDGTHKRYTTVDLQFTYALDNIWKGGRVSAGGRNIFASVPPVDGKNDFIKHNSELYDNIGRRFFVAYGQAF